MENERLVQLGTFAKLYGTKGLVLNLTIDFSEKYLEAEHIYANIDGIYVPFFFVPNETRRKGNRSIVCSFEEVRNPHNATVLLNRKVFIDPEFTEKLDDRTRLEDSMVGFDLENEAGYCGTIQNFIDIARNPIFEVKWDDNTYYLPVNEAFILNIDSQNAKVTVKLPNGILDC